MFHYIVSWKQGDKVIEGYLSGQYGFPSLETAFVEVGDVVCPYPTFVITTHYVGLTWREEWTVAVICHTPPCMLIRDYD